MNKKIQILFLILVLFIQLKEIQTQSSVTSQSASASYVTSFSELDTCVCDLMKLECDPQCCCDSRCTSSQITSWDTQKLCVDKKYPKYLTIPDCSDEATQNVQDLYRVFRLSYTFFRDLLCVNSNNIKHSDLESTYEITKYTQEQTNKIKTINAKLLSTNLVGSQEIPSYFDTSSQEIIDEYKLYTAVKVDDGQQQTAGTLYQMLLPKKNSDICQKTNINLYQRVSQNACFFVVQGNQPELEAQILTDTTEFKIDNYIDTSVAEPTAKVVYQKTASFSDQTIDATNSIVIPAANIQVLRIDQDGKTTFEKIDFSLAENQNMVTASDSTNGLQIKNMVVQIHLELAYDEQASTNQFNSLYSYMTIYIKDVALEIDQNNFIPIINSVKFKKVSTVTIGEDLATIISLPSYRSSGQYGYISGEPLKVGRGYLYTVEGLDNTNDNSVLEFDQPLLNKYMDSTNGNCLLNVIPDVLTTTPIVEDLQPMFVEDTMQIDFGYNTMFQCTIPDTSQDCGNYQIFQTIQFYMEYVGKYGNASPQRINDWIQRDSNAVCTNGQDTIVKIHFAQFGKKNNSVNTIESYTVTTRPSENSNIARVYIEFHEINHIPEEYKAPYPRVTLYLDNDFLYPFFRADSTIIQFTLLAIIVLIF